MQQFLTQNSASHGPETAGIIINLILEAKSYPKAPVAKPPAPKRVLTTEVRPREQALLAARRGTLANACAGGGGAWEASLRCVQELFRIPPITSSFPSDDYQDFALQRLKIDFFNVPMHVIRQTFGECHCACRHRHARRVEGERYTHTHTRHGVVLRCQKRRHAPCRRLTPSSEPRRSRNASPPPRVQTSMLVVMLPRGSDCAITVKTASDFSKPDARRCRQCETLCFPAGYAHRRMD